jgi:hypothetical protein
VVSSLLISICIAISIMSKYVFKEHFPVSAYINIGMAFTLSFF